MVPDALRLEQGADLGQLALADGEVDVDGVALGDPRQQAGIA